MSSNCRHQKNKNHINALTLFFGEDYRIKVLYIINSIVSMFKKKKKEKWFYYYKLIIREYHC